MKRLDLYNKSRMTGDCHVRFCERLRVKLPLPTRPSDRYMAFKKPENEAKYIFYNLFNDYFLWL